MVYMFSLIYQYLLYDISFSSDDCMEWEVSNLMFAWTGKYTFIYVVGICFMFHPHSVGSKYRDDIFVYVHTYFRKSHLSLASTVFP